MDILSLNNNGLYQNIPLGGQGHEIALGMYIKGEHLPGLYAVPALV